MIPAQIKRISALLVVMAAAMLPSGAFADIVMSQSSPSYDFGTSLLNTRYRERTATLAFTNTGTYPQSGRVSLLASSDDIKFEMASFNIYVSPGATAYGHIDIEFTPSSIGQFFETITVITNFGATSDQAIIASCYAGCHIEGHIYDYTTQEIIPASACTSPSFDIHNTTGYFRGHWFAGSYEFMASANGYYSEVAHIFLPEDDTVPWNPKLVPVVLLSEALSELQKMSGATDSRLHLRIDLNQDGKLDFEETLLYLQILAELRRHNWTDRTANLEDLLTRQRQSLHTPE